MGSSPSPTAAIILVRPTFLVNGSSALSRESLFFYFGRVTRATSHRVERSGAGREPRASDGQPVQSCEKNYPQQPGSNSTDQEIRLLLLLANKQKGTLRFVLLLSPWLPFHSWVPHRLLIGDPICRLFPKVYPPKSRGWRPCGEYISEPGHLLRTQYRDSHPNR